VGNVPLVDHAIERVVPVVGAGAVAVNVHHGRDQLEAHLDGRVHVSVEEPVALGTAGAVAHLRPWLDGRAVLVVNADAWHQADLAAMTEGWDGERVRVLVAGRPGEDLGPASRVLGSLLPWSEVASLAAEPSGLYEVCWRPRRQEGRLEVVTADARFVDCGTPADYLDANLAVSGGEPVVGPGAVVEGTLVRSVVWPGGVVGPGEVLVDSVRVGATLTVRAR
jgi:MurNAc alpha-1-phosphate uridylyltransferase